MRHVVACNHTNHDGYLRFAMLPIESLLILLAALLLPVLNVEESGI